MKTAKLILVAGLMASFSAHGRATVSTPCEISRCSEQKTSAQGARWTLVTRTREGHEVWRDDATGKLWSDRLDHGYSHYDAVEIHENKVEKETACASNESLDARGGIVSDHWGLPTKTEWQAAGDHGAREALPNMNHAFWAALPSGRGFAWVFSNGFYGRGNSGWRRGSFSVRCVLR